MKQALVFVGILAGFGIFIFVGTFVSDDTIFYTWIIIMGLFFLAALWNFAGDISNKTKLILLPLLLLISLSGYSQKETKQRFKLFAFNLHHKPHNRLSDTTLATITTVHKIKSYKPSESFRGYVVRSGTRTRYYCLEWVQMPTYLKVVNVKPE